MKWIWILILTGQVLMADQVVFVHGFMRSGIKMPLLQRSFKRSSWDTENWIYSIRDKTIEKHGADLAKSLRDKPGEGPISFVTHSMGGLVLRAAINHPDCAERAKQGRIVLIAPPTGEHSWVDGCINLLRFVGSSRISLESSP